MKGVRHCASLGSGSEFRNDVIYLLRQLLDCYDKKMFFIYEDEDTKLSGVSGERRQRRASSRVFLPSLFLCLFLAIPE
jgi:hypothetical protein